MVDVNDDPVITSETGTVTASVNEGNTEIYRAAASDEDAGHYSHISSQVQIWH